MPEALFIKNRDCYGCHNKPQPNSNSSQLDMICDKLQSTLDHYGRGFFILAKLKVLTINLQFLKFPQG
jgi:hypothetical protein